MTWATFLIIIIACEGTGGDPMVVGDNRLTNKAYGIYQIRKPYVQDINSFYRADVIAKFGKLCTAKDMQNTTIATWYLKKYMWHWGRKFERRHGRKPTWDELARIHNGGPRGYERQSTLSYLKKFHRYREMYCRK